MRRIPNFVLLRAFEAAARHSSFTRAAAELHLTPSAISHQIKELEAYFGRALFVRHSRRIEPTAHALLLLERLTTAFDTIDQACREVAEPRDMQTLLLHCAPSFAVKWLGPALPAFHQACPDITLHLSTGAEPVDLTHHLDIDLTISYGGALQRRGVESLPLGREWLVPMCAPRLLQRGLAPQQALSELTLIDSQLSSLRWDDWFAANRLTLPSRRRPSFDRAALSIAAAVDGMGVILESTRLAARELQQGELVELRDQRFIRIRREMHFVSYRTSQLSRRQVAAFKDWLLQRTAHEEEEGGDES